MSGALAWQVKKNNKKKVSLVLGGDRTRFFARDLFPLCGVALPCLARFSLCLFIITYHALLSPYQYSARDGFIEDFQLLHNKVLSIEFHSN
jgi:hypothetical protein